ncbi:MAG: hypothetical protein CME62_15225 [Halobacteriovoraceae bacterium]|nr:hypothetical protein [Halobacteriovoraceae bacterium]
MSFETDKEEVVRDTLKKIERMKNAAGKTLFRQDLQEEIQLQIKVDNSLPHGRFYPSEVYPGQWRATEQTFKAMKKNIFALGDDIDELKHEYKCESCSEVLDIQFWNFCPFCGESFKYE